MVSSFFDFAVHASSLLLFVLVGVPVVTALLLAVAAVLHISVLRGVVASGREGERARRETEAEAARIIEEARTQAVARLREASAKAEDMIREAHTIVSASQQEIKDALEAMVRKEGGDLAETSRQFIAAYRAVAEQAQKEQGSAIDAVSQKAREEIANAITRFEQTLKDQARVHANAMAHDLADAQTHMREEVEAHKKEVFAKIEESVYRVIQTVAKQVLGKTLNLEEHREIIIHALEQARNEDYFD